MNRSATVQPHPWPSAFPFESPISPTPSIITPRRSDGGARPLLTRMRKPGGIRAALRRFGHAMSIATSLFASLATAAADAGREIYDRQCVGCHGPHGEGVPGKYGDSLGGDRSLDRLLRIIERSMPEDDPDACVGAEAEAVARYVYEAFYSPSSSAARQVARVELAHLTNRQLAESLADLLADPPPFQFSSNTEPGLRAEIFGAANFRRDQRIAEHLDPWVHFDFGLESPDPEQIPPKEFAIRWRGSLRSEETGDHEIILETENGARLWLNDDDEPLIDAWVASSGRMEHRAVLRLLGGRAYPLRLEFRKTSERTAFISLQWRPPHGVREPIPARQLSPDPIRPTLVITTPFPPDDASAGYERGVSLSRAWDEAATRAAIEVAHHVEARLNSLAGTRAEAPDRADKIRALCGRLAERAFRRPLTPEQKDRFVHAWFQTGVPPEEAAKRSLLLTLKSPHFLYPGLQPHPPDAYTVAARLASALWDSLPDAALLKAAADGRLTRPDEASRHARRMLTDPRARSKVRHALHHWLHVDRAEDLTKDTGLFPDFSPRIIADLRTSLNLFLDDIVWGDPPDYRRLLLAADLPLNERLARFYGVDHNPAPASALPDFVETPLDPRVRAGVLTHPFLLAAFSYPRSSSPIHRGVFLTRNIVGRALRPPPAAVAFNESDFDPNLTMREKVTQLTRPEACQTCHSVINPLGFSLEHYDAVGRYRTTEGDRPIDATSAYTDTEGTVIQLNGPRDLAEFAAGSASAQDAFVEQIFHQVVKQPVLAYGPDTLNQLRTSFASAGFDVRRLLVEIAVRTALHGLGEENSKTQLSAYP